jgi:hypothetical protein
MLRRVALVGTDVLGERIASIIRVTRVSGLVFLCSVLRLLVTANIVPICHPDDGSDTFLRNICSYKSNTV